MAVTGNFILRLSYHTEQLKINLCAVNIIEKDADDALTDCTKFVRDLQKKDSKLVLTYRDLTSSGMCTQCI
jgi:hypothetical protein